MKVPFQTTNNEAVKHYYYFISNHFLKCDPTSDALNIQPDKDPSTRFDSQKEIMKAIMKEIMKAIIQGIHADHS